MARGHEDTSDVVRAVIWRRLDTPALEHCALARDGAGWRFDGAVIVAFDGQPALVRYRVACDPAWHTREVAVEMVQGATTRALLLTADTAGRWWRDGAELPDLAGFRDIDLGVTPSTNTLPIRRLRPAVGESHDITAAWVRFPELTLEPLPQRYTRLAADRYRYESNGGRFTAEIAVDDLGLVTRYTDLFERLAVTDGPGADR